MDFKATRMGETDRACTVCGTRFVPNSRTQKYCAACKQRVIAERRQAAKAKA